METVTLSSKYQMVVPKSARARLGLKPGVRLTVIEKGGILFLVPERPVARYRGVARGATPRALRDKKDRL